MLIKTEIEVHSAHRLSGYDGPCQRIHGHAWLFKVFIVKHELDNLGMVFDFKEIKKLINVLDHRTILNSENAQNRRLTMYYPVSWVVWFPFNPTCENLAKHYANLIRVMTNAKFVKVKVYETKKSYAEYTADGVDEHA